MDADRAVKKLNDEQRRALAAKLRAHNEALGRMYPEEDDELESSPLPPPSKPKPSLFDIPRKKNYGWM